MTNLFHRGIRYFRKSWNNEHEFETFVHSKISNLFPHINCYKFKMDVFSEEYDRTMVPDLLLVDYEYSCYVVVEVELITDSISHVKQQAEVFSSANYTQSMVSYLSRNNPQIDSSRMLELFTYHRPEVLILLNDSRFDERWDRVLVDENVHLASFEAFTAESRESIYHYSGFIPDEQKNLTIFGKKSTMMNNLVVNAPNLIPVDEQNQVQIIDNGTLVLFQKQGEILFPLSSSSVDIMPPRSGCTISKSAKGHYFQLKWLQE